jgi:hypothetical protein
LFAITSILATASLLGGTFANTAMAQGSITPIGDSNITICPSSANMTEANGNTTGIDNSTEPY